MKNILNFNMKSFLTILLSFLSINLIFSDCDDGFIEINNLCFFEDDINIIQQFIDNSYQSNIDLGCEEWDEYCGSPNPYMDNPESWFWKIIDGQSYNFSNGDGIVEPLELGIQEWVDGRLKSIMCGAYIYCQLSGPIPQEINHLTEIEVFRVEGNYFSGIIPESICDLNINYNNSLDFDVTWNRLCPPYPECIVEGDFWYQDTSECSYCDEGYVEDCNGDGECCPEDWIGDGWCDDGESSTSCNLICYEEEFADCDQCSSIAGDLNLDNETNIQDVVIIINCILDDNCDECSDMNADGINNVLDVIYIINIILE